MSRFRHILNSFIGGEISPNVFARTELDLYKRSVEELFNAVVKTKGGVSNRPGTQFIAKEYLQQRIWDGYELNGGSPLGYTGHVRIIPFVFSRDEAYAVILRADGYNSSIAIVNVNTLAQATFDGEYGPVLPFGRAPNASGIETVLFTGWANDEELDEVQYAQSGDILFLCHKNHPHWILKRIGPNDFQAVFGMAKPDGSNFLPKDNYGSAVPYQAINSSTTHTMTIAAGFNNTINSSVSYFTPADVGSWIRVQDGASWFYFFLGEYVSDTQMKTGGFFPTGFGAPAVGPTTVWARSQWGERYGWPRSVTLHEQRLYFGGNNSYPDTTWGSEIGDLFEFNQIKTPAGAVANSHAFSFTVASTEVNEIQFLSSSKNLVIGTLGREYIARGSQSALGPTDILVSPETAHGSRYRQPIRNENTLLFISRNANKIREFVFSRDEDSYVADDLMKFSDHMLLKAVDKLGDAAVTPQISYLVKQDTTETVIWMLDNNGGIYSATRDRASEVNGWAYHELGGSLDGSFPIVHSLTVVPSGDGTHDDLWMTVERTIDGNNVTYIERMNREFSLIDLNNTSTSILDKMVYSDSAILHKAAPFTVVPGLSHLEGETVTVVADGWHIGDFVVTGGQIDLVREYSEAIVGLKYQSRIKTLRMDAGSQLETAQGAMKRIDQLTIRFVRTIGAKFGSDLNYLDKVLFRPPTLPLNQPIPLFTGDKLVDFPSSYDRDGYVYIVQDLPLPMTVAGLIMRGTLYD